MEVARLNNQIRADRMKTAESESQQKPDTTFETQLSFAQPALSMDAYLAQVRAGDGSRVKFRPRLATISTLRCACNSRLHRVS